MPRRTAYQTLLKIEAEAAYSHITLDQHLSSARLTPQDARLATALTYTCLAWQSAIDQLIRRYLSMPIQQLDLPVLIILRLGTCQAHFMDRIPDHALVHESVEMCKTFAPEKTALVNAVLRKVTRDDGIWYDNSIDSHTMAKKPAKWLGSRWSLPSWLANRLIQQFKGEADEAAKGLQQRGPLYVRRILNGGLGDTEKRNLEELEGFQGEVVEGVEGAYKVGQAVTEDGRTLFEDPRWVVQDLGSQLVGWFAAPVGAKNALDACAGLGGKSLQLLECCKELVAVEPNASKLGKLNTSDALERILSSAVTGLEGGGGECKEGAQVLRSYSSFVGRLQDYFSTHKTTFDHILVDAPCTGLGVIRRHPETKWLRKESDIQALAAIQGELLDCAAQHVAPGGTLVYSVCTFTVEETVKQVEKFLERHPNWSLDTDIEKTLKGISTRIAWSNFVENHTFLRVYPHSHDTDAFFAARLTKSR